MDPIVMQRGATALHFPRLESAVDIPPESSYDTYSDIALALGSDPKFAVILSAPDGPVAEPLTLALAAEHGCSPEDVRKAIQAEVLRRSGRPAEPIIIEDDIETAEWLAFRTPRPEQDSRDRFVTQSVEILSADSNEPKAFARLAAKLDQVVLATTLREVRALVGFTRVDPSAKFVPADLGRQLGWLPAIEVYGEGIFVALNEELLSEWEQIPAVRSRGQDLEMRRSETFLAERLPAVTPRFLMIHTLTHLLIRRLSFECGYAASSLRERLYTKTDGDIPQAGFLIYTAAGDVEGTMGGLVRQGEPPRMLNTLSAALEAGAWCSTDPICAESTGQGFGAMNLAACHACALLPETSCVYGNAGLDRAVVVGSATFGDGYFTDVLRDLLGAVTAPIAEGL